MWLFSLLLLIFGGYFLTYTQEMCVSCVLYVKILFFMCDAWLVVVFNTSIINFNSESLKISPLGLFLTKSERN